MTILEEKLENCGFDFQQIKEDAREEFNGSRFKKVVWDPYVNQINLNRLKPNYLTLEQP